MNLLHAPISLPWAVAGWLLLLVPIWRAVHEVRRAKPLGRAQQHLWLAGVVCLAWLWTLHVRTADGAAFGLLGAAFYALVFGRHWARLGLLAAVVLNATLAGGNWANVGINGWLLAVIPSALASSLQQQLERRLPRNLFIFIIGNGLFVTLTVTAASSVLLVGAASLLTAANAAGDQIAYALLLAWGEALASGMLFSALVIFGPHLVLTYRQDIYLPPRQRP